MRPLTDKWMIKIVLTGFLTGLIIGISVAQTSITREGSVLDILDPNSQNTDLTFSTRYPDYQGSPYIFEDWKSGSVTTHNGQKLQEVQLNLDLYSHQWLVQYEDKAYALAEDIISRVIVDSNSSKDRIFVPLSLPPDGKTRFVQLLYEDQMRLIKTFEIQLNTIENNSGGYGTSTNAPEIKRFVQTIIYYVMDLKGELLYSFEGKKKAVQDAFQDREDIQKFIKRNKFKFKDDTDIIQLVQYYEDNL